MTQALGRARPPLAATLAGSAIWALAMGGGALVNLVLDGWETAARIRFVALLFAIGGALAFPAGLFLARLVSAGRRSEAAFAASVVSLTVCTIAITAALYALQYRSYYAEWHAPAFTVTWAIQFLFTTAVAFYQFAVLGIRLYFPVGFLALAVAGLWFARRPR